MVEEMQGHYQRSYHHSCYILECERLKTKTERILQSKESNRLLLRTYIKVLIEVSSLGMDPLK